MSPIRWTADRMDQLENAARRGFRVALSRRGTEYIVVALKGKKLLPVAQLDRLAMRRGAGRHDGKVIADLGVVENPLARLDVVLVDGLLGERREMPQPLQRRGNPRVSTLTARFHRRSGGSAR